MKRPLYVIPALALAMLAWAAGARTFLACYLGVWWFVTGTLMGGLANVWLHTLTGGRWGEAARVPLLRAARWIPLACLLFLPVLFGMHQLYPWAADADIGVARWHGQLSDPGFKSHWLRPGWFVARSAIYLLLWSGASLITRRPKWERSRTAAAAGLLVYAFSTGLAAVDWIMSLQPLWYSSVFGWLAATGQMLGGLSLAIVLIDRDAHRRVLPDLGNLLLMYVMTWAYLAYVQFLIIWAENLPHEISWYVARRELPWQAFAWVLVAFHCVAPIVILLSRHAKRAPRLMGAMAGTMLAVHLLDCWWLVLPSAVSGRAWMWAAPLLAVAFGLAAWAAWWRAGREVAHA